MKILTTTLLAGLGLLGTSFAGHEVTTTGKDYKTPIAPTCFGDHEFQIDVFGAYIDGNAPNHAGPVRDHGWGGGIGINYFFTRMLGLGVDASWLDAKENAAGSDSNDSKSLGVFTGSLIVRFPDDNTCLAPYLFVGGGLHINNDEWASAHAGLGIEYRVVPNRVGLFADARWNYFGTRYGHEDQNNFMGRAGVRFVF